MFMCTYSRQFSPILYIFSLLNRNLYRHFSTLLVFHLLLTPPFLIMFIFFSLCTRIRGRILTKHSHHSQTLFNVYMWGVWNIYSYSSTGYILDIYFSRALICWVRDTNGRASLLPALIWRRNYRQTRLAYARSYFSMPGKTITEMLCTIMTSTMNK
jgi:hypothetical protein